MPQLPELVARRWSEAKAAFESSVKSGSQPPAGVDVDAILDQIAGLIRTVGREELQAVVKASGATPRPSPRVVHLGVADPMATTDGGNGPAETTDPDSPGASASGFELDRIPTTDGKIPTLDQTGAYSSDDNGVVLLDSRGETKPEETKAPRRVPTVPGYEIVGILGRGGMGVVYKATQSGLRRTVALKMILSGEHASTAQLSRFAAEARAVAQIHHPSIVQIYEIGDHDGLPYFSLEFCPGGSLDKKLKHEPQPPRDAALLTRQLAQAMAAAHAAGVVHRDLKPANVLLDAGGIPKITDFGLARELDDAEGQTRTGSILGTPSYMSPEQALGLREVGPAADQYSLGATLYELLTGRPPFQGASIMETLEQVRSREPVPPSQLSPACPRDLETICLKALQKDPAKRYPSCAALADDLSAYLDGRPITARPVGNVEKAWRWAKRNPRVAGLASLVVFLMFVVAGGGATAAAIFDTKKREAEGLAEERRVAKELAEVKQAEAEKARDEKDVALKSETKALQEKSLALEAESKALRASDQSYELTRETIFVALDEIPVALAQAIFARGVEQQVLQALGAMLEKQMGLALQRGLPDRAMMNFHLKMGGLMARRGKGPEAEKHFRSALAITERLMKTEEREKDKAKGNHALVLRRLGGLIIEMRRDGAADALALFASATKLQREILNSPQTREIPPAEAKIALANTLMDTADLYRRVSYSDRALPLCEEARTLLDEVVKAPVTPYTTNAPLLLAETYVMLGRILTNLGRDQDAEKALVEGTNRHRTLHKASPGNALQQGLAARAARELGDFLLMRGKLDEATPHHEGDLELTRGLLQAPEILSAQSELSDVYYRSATLLLKKGDRPGSDKLYRKCLDLRLAVAEGKPKDDRQTIRVANAQARCGMHAEVAASMGVLADTFKDDNYAVRQAAFNFAICVDSIAAGRPDEKLSIEEKKLREDYKNRSLTLLEDLVRRLNYVNVVQLKTDPDLDAIRPDPRFQALVKKLEVAKKPK